MASYKQCIEKHCKWCIYDDVVSGSWRQQVENCTDSSCHLWEVRPKTTKTTDNERKKQIPVVVDTAS